MLLFRPVFCKYAAVCSSSGVFFCIWIIVALPNFKMTQIIIFSSIDAAFSEKSYMLHFWPVCCKYAAVCSCNGFFFAFQIIIALFYVKMLQIMILDPFLTIFNEKSNMQPFWPVCSNYAAICSNRDFFSMSTPSSLIRHAKLVLIPNFGASFIKIIHESILGT